MAPEEPEPRCQRMRVEEVVHDVDDCHGAVDRRCDARSELAS